MSKVLWCDIGQHPFPQGQVGATTVKIEQQVKNQWGGVQPSDVAQDVCSSCARDAGIRRIQDMGNGQSEAELDAMADEIRNATGGRNRFSRMMKAIGGENGSVHDPAEARARGYDPDYVAWLEKQANESVQTEG